MQTQLFKYQEDNHFNDFRTVGIDGEIWFVATDVTTILGYTNSSKAITDHCKEKGITKRYPLPTKGGMQSVTLLNESNLYRLIVKSKLPSAEKFEDWLFTEVLPSIRKTGQYSSGINRIETPNFVIRYMENFKNVAKDRFSVITELYTRLYAQLEHAGYQIPNKTAKGVELRPDVSVGKHFAAFISDYHPDMDDDFTMYQHDFPDGSSFPARQYSIEYLPIFIKFVDNVWIPKHAERYFKERDLKALEFLPKLLRAS